uniref:EGF-like domain-containing protein n=1 Tax=Odontella aurita TaxID=265563 RepID=A0A7S4N2V1_9STRA
MFCASHRSHAFFVSIGVFAFQILILILVLVDIRDPSNGANPLNIPAGVSGAVRAAQFLAVLVAVGTQDDVITSINSIHEGYPGRRMSVATESGYGAGGLYWQWILAVSCRGAEGALCLVATFILIIQSSGVIDLFLDFLAVTFVSTLDNIAFNLALEGYFSRQMKMEAEEVDRVRIPKIRSANRSAFARHRIHCRPTMFLFISCVLVAAWSVVVSNQNRGHYVSCDNILCQFGDSFAPELAFFSGVYVMSEAQIAGRAVYMESNPGASKWNGSYQGSAMLAYCEDEGAWTFSYSREKGTDPDPCLSWHAKAESQSYDLMELSPSDWYVLGSESKDEVPFVHFSYECADCECDAERGLCSKAGACTNNRCVCDKGRYGTRCEYEKPCTTIEVDTSAEGFRGVQSKKYSVLNREDEDETKVLVYGRPVFIGASSNGGGPVDLIFFTGRRWLLTKSSSFKNNNRMQTVEGVADFLSNDFHGHWSDFNASYFSAPMDMNTPSDSMSPIRLQWYRAKTFHTRTSKNAVDDSRPVPTMLLCSRCDPDTNPCSNGGQCINGTCVCSYGSFGALCQVGSDFVLPRSLAIQFGDEVRSSLGAFSGVYDITDDTQLIDGRAVYYERRLGKSMIAYCESAQAWVFGPAWYPEQREGATKTLHCDNWIVMSTKTESYDITEASGWVVHGADHVAPLTHISMSCNDCDAKGDRACNGSGRCISNQCVCEPGRYGLNCELHEPCQQVEVDASKPIFPGFLSRSYSILSFDNGTEVKVHERPVYVARDAKKMSFDIIAFIGRRWVVTSSASHALVGNDPTSNEVATYMSRSFHGSLSNYTIDFISEPADVNTLIDTPSPVDLVWFRPKSFDNRQVDLNQPIQTGLICSYCNGVDYVCFNGGKCVCEGNDCSRGHCSCPYATFGTLCQVHSLCDKLFVQFGPELLGGMLASVGGTYRMSSSTHNERPVYVLQGVTNATGRAFLAYCRDEKSWTFSVEYEESDTGDWMACSQWIAKSSPSYTFDVTSLGSWVVRQNITSDALAPLSSFSLSCMDENLRNLLV